MSNKIISNYDDPSYPSQPVYNNQCAVNEIYKTIPNDIPWVREASGPATIKHLYTGIPNFYPYRKMSKPYDSLYGYDLSQFHKSGVGEGKRISYTYKVYPLTNRHARETREYADKLLPYMDFREWTKYPVERDATLNSPLFKHPNAYLPEY